MSTIYYYGDQRITGNYTQQQNFTLLGPAFYSVNVLTASTTSNIGASSAPWDNLYVKSANVLVLQTSSLATLNVNTPSAPGSPYIANIFGNVYASNSVTAFSVNTANLSVPSLTLSTSVGGLGIGGIPPPGVSLYVVGNVFVSGNLIVPNASITNLNTISISTNSLALGDLNVLGNAFVSRSIEFDQYLSTNLPYTVEDLTRRSPHLIPNATNGPAIQAWISATCNASSQPQRSFWTSATRPLFSNTSPNTPYYYKGGVLLPDGRVLFVPFRSTRPGFYQSKTRTFSTAPASGLTSGNFAYGVLLPTGNVIFCPQTSNVGMYNPVNSTFSNCASLPGGSYSGTLSPTGNVIFTPTGVPSNIIHWNYTTGIQKNCYSFSSAVPPANPWSGVTTTGYTSTDSTRISTTWSDELGIFCVVSYGSGASGTSADGLNWTFGPSVIMNGTCTGVVWVPELKIFCTISTNRQTPLVSRDGLNWTSGQNLSFQEWGSIAWSPQLGIFCIIGTNRSAISKDGLIWTEKSDATLSRTWPAITWSPQLGIFCALNMDPNGTVSSATSPDGQNWIPGGMYSNFGASTGSIAWSPQLGIFCASHSAVGTSTDGLLWSYLSISAMSPPYSIDWSSQLGLFCIVSTNRSSGPYVTTSMDGVSWSSPYIAPFGSKAGYTSVTWSPGLGIFSVILSDGNYLYSTISSRMRSAIQSGSILLPNGNVLTGSPGTSNIIQYDPVTLIGSNLYVGTAGFNGLVLTPNGNVIGVPQNSNVLVINPSSFTSSNVTVPPAFFGGGCLTPSGNVVFAPSVSSSNVGMFDPVARTYSNSTPAGASFSSATLVPNGQVVFSGGVLDTMTPVPIEFCLNPYINKF